MTENNRIVCFLVSRERGLITTVSTEHYNTFKEAYDAFYEKYRGFEKSADALSIVDEFDDGTRSFKVRIDGKEFEYQQFCR